MEGQQKRAGGNHKRRRGKTKAKAEPKGRAAPVLIAARRPDAPPLSRLHNRGIVASAQPKRPRDGDGARFVRAGSPASSDALALEQGQSLDGEVASNPALPVEKPRRVARIALTQGNDLDEREQRRRRLLARLVACEGRSAISRIADELLSNDFVVPEEQEIQLQLLEHVDEGRARDAMEVMSRLLGSEAPIKRPILDQRLRRLEEEADEAETRSKAAALRRQIRAA